MNNFDKYINQQEIKIIVNKKTIKNISKNIFFNTAEKKALFFKISFALTISVFVVFISYYLFNNKIIASTLEDAIRKTFIINESNFFEYRKYNVENFSDNKVALKRNIEVWGYGQNNIRIDSQIERKNKTENKTSIFISVFENKDCFFGGRKKANCFSLEKNLNFLKKAKQSPEEETEINLRQELDGYLDVVIFIAENFSKLDPPLLEEDVIYENKKAKHVRYSFNSLAKADIEKKYNYKYEDFYIDFWYVPSQDRILKYTYSNFQEEIYEILTVEENRNMENVKPEEFFTVNYWQNDLQIKIIK